MKQRTLKTLFLSSFLLFSLTGCWSSKEIEELGFVAGTAMDLKKEDPFKGDMEGPNEGSSKQISLTLTNQFFTAQTNSQNTQKGGSQKSYQNITESGHSVISVLRKMVLKNEKRSFGQHSKVIVISADLARKVNLQKLLDFFLREVEIRQSSYIFIAKNSAKKTLETKESSVIPAYHLFQITKSQERTTKILHSLPLAKLQGKLHSGTSFLLQNLVTEKGEVKFSGAAVIKGKSRKLVGFINEKDIEGLNWLTGKAKGGLVNSIDKETGQPVTYEIKTLKSKITPHMVKNQISFDVKIESQGTLAEHWDRSGKPSDEKFLKKAEKNSEEEVEHLIKNVLVKTQKKYKIDVVEFGKEFQIKYPRTWEKIKKDWEQTFSNVPIHYSVDIKIIDYGTLIGD
ncbi:Ger(x)C family spore germination protein [Neobacillus sp. LXY-1]|uniref:Ger(x)C family spore germination protein n=1 Tax=Neobacillus sp. LXY-1 TaxID=3379133 RepID=UPI003EE06FFF